MVKLECDLCGKLVTEDKSRDDGSIEEWESHADAVSPLVNAGSVFAGPDCSTVCGACYDAVRTVVSVVVQSLRRIRPTPPPEPYEVSTAVVGAIE